MLKPLTVEHSYAFNQIAMDLEGLQKARRIHKDNTSREEIQELLRVAARWLRDAHVEGLSPEGRCNSAHEAVLELATIPLRCMNYRARGEGYHQTTLELLPEIMGEDVREMALYFQECRRKRNDAVYRQSNVVSIDEVIRHIEYAEKFNEAVRRWLKLNYPEYC